MAKAKSKEPAAKKSPAKAKGAKKAKKPVPTKAKKPVPAKAKKPAAKKAVAKKPVAKPAAKKPAAKKPAAKKPAAKKAAKAAPATNAAHVNDSARITFIDVTNQRAAQATDTTKKGLVAKLVEKVKSVVGGGLAKKAQPEPGKRPPPPASETPAGLSPELKARIQAALPEGSFAEHVRNLSVHAEGAWAHADMPELVGLERWGRELAAKDKLAAIAALVEAARYGFPRAGEVGREELVDAGFFADHASVDGAPVETQIELCAAWLDNPDHVDDVNNAFDRTRQLNVWDDDLRPEDGRAYWWYTEVGQCCCAAIMSDSGKPDGETYYEWDAATIIGRGLVMAVRGIRYEETNVVEILDEMRDAMLA